MRFAKYHGTGNDFVLIEDVADEFTLTAPLVAGVCDRRFGVGADGVIRIAPAAEGDFLMDYRNANGELAEMCGNGIRCLAKYAYDRGLTRETRLLIETRAGMKPVTLNVEGDRVAAVRVDMGEPALARGAMPMAGAFEERFIEQPFMVDGTEYRATAVSMGNPHLVLFGATDLDAIDLPRIGPMVEHHRDFPERTNVEFVRVQGGAVEARVWERGSGETMACGTGGCAAFVASNIAGLVGTEATVRFPGGTLRVEWAKDGRIYLTGPAVHVFDGELDPDAVVARAEAVR
ncbi:MAG: diaminopimelate epimerase [Actinomycetota bacterium]